MKCEEDIHLIYQIGFIFGPICQTVFGCLGILGNLTAIYVIFRSKKLQSVYYNLIICHMAIQTIFIITSVLNEHYFYYKMHFSHLVHSLFAYITFPLKQVLLHTATYLIGFMAKER